jgi:hypothetical protein
MKVDWTKENEIVRDALFAVMKAHDLHELMTTEQKARFDELFNEMLESSKEDELVKEEVKPSE